MPATRVLAPPWFGELAAGVFAAMVLVGCGAPSHASPAAAGITATFRPPRAASMQPAEVATATASAPAALPGATALPSPMDSPAANVFVPAPLIKAELDLRAAAVDVPLELRIPTLQVNAPVTGVGLTAASSMDAPQGPAGDPVWQKVFWYRGSAVPGEASTATIAGHVDDVLGRPAVFARLKELRLGDQIFVRDTRNGLDVRFVVTSVESYTVQQADALPILTQIYGSGPVSGMRPQPALDGQAHLTLITCNGNFTAGSYDRRLVAYATRG